MLAKGKQKAVSELGERPAELAGYSVAIEAGVPVVRAHGCEKDGAQTSPCTHSVKLDVPQIHKRASQAATLEAKVVIFEALVSSAPPTAGALALVQREQVEYDKKEKTRGTHFLSKPSAEQLLKLKQTLYGLRGQQSILSTSFVHRIEPPMLRAEKSDLLIKVAEVGELSPTVRQYVAKVSEGGAHAQEMEGLLSMYCEGSLQQSNQALFGMMIGMTEKHKREQRGVDTARGIQLDPAVTWLLLTLGKHGSKVVKTVSKNLLGYEVNLSNLRRHLPRMLNLPEGKTIELIAPSEEKFERTCVMMLIHTHMDPTKLAEALQFCQRRKAYVGGDMRHPKIIVTSGLQAGTVIERIEHIAPADQANIMAISPVIAGYPAYEVAALPERHSRKGLSDKKRDVLHPATTAKMVFEQTDTMLRMLWPGAVGRSTRWM